VNRKFGIAARDQHIVDRGIDKRRRGKRSPDPLGQDPKAGAARQPLGEDGKRIVEAIYGAAGVGRGSSATEHRVKILHQIASRFALLHERRVEIAAHEDRFAIGDIALSQSDDRGGRSFPRRGPAERLVAGCLDAGILGVPDFRFDAIDSMADGRSLGGQAKGLGGLGKVFRLGLLVV
jgi:hypothetical protein